MPTAKKKSPAKSKKTTTKKTPAKKVETKKRVSRKTFNELSQNMMKVLESLKGGEKTAREITENTGIVKGRRLPELVEKGHVSEMVPVEGKRGKRFKILASGRKALDKALKEQSKS